MLTLLQNDTAKAVQTGLVEIAESLTGELWIRVYIPREANLTIPYCDGPTICADCGEPILHETYVWTTLDGEDVDVHESCVTFVPEA